MITEPRMDCERTIENCRTIKEQITLFKCHIHCVPARLGTGWANILIENAHIKCGRIAIDRKAHV